MRPASLMSLYGRFVRAMAWRSRCSFSGLSRYMVWRIGTSKPVRSMSVTMRIFGYSSSLYLSMICFRMSSISLP